MRITRTRLGAIAISAAVFLGAAVLPASPALAANPSCSSTQSKSFDLPNKNDITVHIYLCFAVNYTGADEAHGGFNARWSYNSLPPLGSLHRFDKFSAKVNIEHRSTTTGGDSVLKSVTCDLTDWANGPYQQDTFSTVCSIGGVGYYSAGYWSLDATVTYDIDNDGLGASNWGLTGTPLY